MAPTLALVIIARSDSKGLLRAVSSARHLVDEVVIGIDDRSDDDTWAVAQELATTAYKFGYADIGMSEEDWKADKFHFANARNFNLAKVTADWLFQIDSDEYLRPGADLQSVIADTTHVAFNIQIELGGTLGTVTRLLKRGTFRWDRATHNQVVAQGTCGDAPGIVLVQDTGIRDAKRQAQRDAQRDVAVRATRTEAEKGDISALFHLAKHMLASATPQEAEPLVTDFRFRTWPHGPWAGERFWLAIGLAHNYYEREDFENAELWAVRTLLDGPYAEAFCMLGDLAEDRGDLAQALTWYDIACAAPETDGKYALPGLVQHRTNRREGLRRAHELGAGDAIIRIEPPITHATRRPRHPNLHVIMGRYYPDGAVCSATRRNELDVALRANLDNQHVATVWLHANAEELARVAPHPKLRSVTVTQPITFAGLFAFASERLAGETCAILNADTYITPISVGRLPVLDTTVLCLSRWEAQTRHGKAFQGRSNSQSAWIFESPLLVPDATFSPWLSGCENRLAHMLNAQGRTPWNPSRDIHIMHIHASDERPAERFARSVPPPYAAVPVSSLVVTPTAHVPDDQLLRHFTQRIRDAQPVSFVKFGDGEVLCMAGIEGENADRHPYSRELGEDLARAFRFLAEPPPDVWLARWHQEHVELLDAMAAEWKERPRWAPYNMLLLREGALTADLLAFYRAIKESKSPKIFVGPAQLAAVPKLLNADAFVTVPAVNAYSALATIEDQVLHNLNPDAIVLMCAGMPSKVLAHHILQRFETVSVLDLGSAFDPLRDGGGQPATRSGQASSEDVHNFLAPLNR